MSSASSSAASPGSVEGRDLTARARIRDAAIARFAQDGVSGTSVRSIAAEAGVSPALVIHHFGSKDGMRIVCDEHVAATIRERKHAAMAEGGDLDPLATLQEADRERPHLLGYLARTLVDGSPHVAELVDELISDAVGYMEQGVASGAIRPSEHPRDRAAVLTIWSLGAVVLHEHLRRNTGADLLGGPEQMGPYALPAAELLTHGVLDPQIYERVRDAFTPESEDER